MIRASIAIIFSILISSCYMISDDIEAGVSTVRGGDIVITHAQPIKGDAMIFTIDNSQQDLTKSIGDQDIPSEMKETEVASMISHIIGSTPMSGYVPKQVKSFPSSTVLHKPLANVLISIADVGQVNSAQLGMSRIQNMRQQYPNYVVTSTFEPRNLMSQITTISTGELPSVHGVMGSKWIASKSSTSKSSVSHNKQASDAFVPTYADVLANSFDQSLIVGLSASAQLAAATHIHENDEANAHMFFVDSETKTVQQSSSNGLKSIADVDSDSIAQFVSKTGPQSLLENFLHEGSTISVVGSKVVVQLFGTKSETVEFDLNNKADALFFGELLALDSLFTELKSGSLSQFTSDSSPDSFSLTLSGFKEILSENSVSSRKAIAAAQILDAVVPKALGMFNQLYHSESTSEVLLLGSPTKLSDADVKKDIVSEIDTRVHKNIEIESTYPTIYVEESLSHDELQALCSRVHNSVSKYGLKANCIREFTQPAFLQQKTSIKQTSNSTTTAENVIAFQINLWISFAFVLIILAAVYPLMYSDFTSGTFSSFLFAKKYV